MSNPVAPVCCIVFGYWSEDKETQLNCFSWAKEPEAFTLPFCYNGLLLGLAQHLCRALVQLIITAEVGSLCLQQDLFRSFQSYKTAVHTNVHFLFGVSSFMTFLTICFFCACTRLVRYHVKKLPVQAENWAEGIYNRLLNSIFWFFLEAGFSQHPTWEKVYYGRHGVQSAVSANERLFILWGLSCPLLLFFN